MKQTRRNNPRFAYASWRLAISRGFSAGDLDGVLLPGSANALADIGVETRLGVVCDLESSFNIDQKRFRFVLRSDSTEPRTLITATLSYIWLNLSLSQ